jgi:hypothetical protein
VLCNSIARDRGAGVVPNVVFFNEWKALANVQRFDVLIAAIEERVKSRETPAR